MRLLLDTHVYIWWLQDNRKLSNRVREAVGEPLSQVYVSAASIWEIAIKSALGRLRVAADNLTEEIDRNNFLELPMTAKHSEAAGGLPRHHEDPFDRMLIAQAQLEGLTCVTRDPRFSEYEVAVFW